MKKYYYLKQLLMMLAILSIQLSYGAYIKGDRVFFGNMKAGDKIILRNATCDIGSTSYSTQGATMWLNGNTSGKGIGNDGPVLQLQTMDDEGIISPDFVFELESAGSSSVSGKPTFILKNMGTGKYLSVNFRASNDYEVLCNGDKSSAVVLEPDSASKWCQWFDDMENHNGWAFETTQIDDSTMALMKQEGTTDSYTTYFFGPFWNYGPIYFGTARDIVVWNAYYAKEDNSPKAVLSDFCNMLEKEIYTYHAGTNPGDYAEADISALLDLEANALSMLEEDHSDEEYTTAYNELKAAYDKLMASAVPIEDGYYNIVNAYDAYLTQQNVEKAMTINADHQLAWGDYNAEDPMQLFKITKIADGQYSIENTSMEEYANSSQTKEKSQTIYTTTTQTTPQTITEYGKSGQWKIANTYYNEGYHTAGHQSGAGESGLIVTWSGEMNSASAWFLRKVTDNDLLQKLLNSGQKKAIIAVLEKGVATGQATADKVIDHDPLVTNASQFSTNSMSAADYGSLEHLIDGQTHYKYNFHSIWNNAMGEKSTTEDLWKSVLEETKAANSANIAVGTGYHNLQVKFNNPTSKFYFKYINRTGTSYVDNPTDIEIFATSDDALGASTDQADIDKWTRITELTEGFPSYVQGAQYTSPTIDLGAEYKYVRFVMKATSQMNKKKARSFAVPEITGVTWNIGEFQLYDPEVSKVSEYNIVPGMKDAYETLIKEIDNVKAKLESGNVSYSDTTALYAAIKAVDALYVDRDSISSALNSSISTANNLYSSLLKTQKPLIHRASQLSTNSSLGDELSYLNYLIDGNTNTAFHSMWAMAMATDGISEEEWNNVVDEVRAGGTGNIFVGTGYHNLQVKFDEPVQKFTFSYTGRNSDSYHDNPNDFLILATNDDEVASTTDNANQSEWTEITELKEGSANSGLAKYTSPEIDLGAAYKYVRFVIKNTTTAFYNPGDGTLNRLFMNPDLTGVTWNVSEFQMYANVDSAELQYKSDAELHAAADSLNAMATADASVDPRTLTDGTLNAALTAQIDRVNSLIADPTEFNNLYANMSKMAETAGAGSDPGYVDGQQAIDDFSSAIAAAKAAVDAKTSKATLESGVAALKDAYAAFEPHVVKPQAGVWYNIVNLTDAEDQPVYLSGVSAGDVLMRGNFSIDRLATADMAAIWRLAPVEGHDGEYAIQSMATGQYFGEHSGDGEDNPILLSHAKTPYKLTYAGNGAFRLSQASVESETNALRANPGTRDIANEEGVADDAQGWKFIPVETSETMQLIAVPDNSIQVFTLPFATGGENAISELNPAVKTYAVMSFNNNNDSALNLKEKTDFAAGEPMVLVVNDFSDASLSHTSFTLELMAPEDVVDSAITANGLVGTLPGMNLTAQGMGIFFNSQAFKVIGMSGANISGLSGYVDPRQVVNEDGAADLSLGAKDVITRARGADIKAAKAFVDVYTVDGQLLRKGVSSAKATQGLSRGIYIVGKKKVLVK